MTAQPKKITGTQQELAWLRSPRTIRQQSQKLFDAALSGKTHFQIQLDKLPEVAGLVLDVTRSNYPDLNVPFHARWRHFQAGNQNRIAEWNQKISQLDQHDQIRASFDLAITSVLLDAGAGPDWKYRDARDQKDYSRSEGLAIASFDAFVAGVFSSDPVNHPLRADAVGLERLETTALARAFQVSPTNPLIGVEGRTELLRGLGKAVRQLPRSPAPKSEASVHRAGSLLDVLLPEIKGQTLEANTLLQAVLRYFSPIWPGRTEVAGENAGDAWHHSLLGTPDTVTALVPFHKLSQWLTYSLMEPLENAKIRISGVSEMTGLPEYRNGGLLLDSGLIQLRDSQLAHQEHRVDSELVIEWRALTICLLDLIGREVQKLLDKTPEELPLVKVLEGGTWWAGRKLAAQARTGGTPPLKIILDGTVF